MLELRRIGEQQFPVDDYSVILGFEFRRTVKMPVILEFGFRRTVKIPVVLEFVFHIHSLWPDSQLPLSGFWPGHFVTLLTGTIAAIASYPYRPWPDSPVLIFLLH